MNRGVKSKYSCSVHSCEFLFEEKERSREEGEGMSSEGGTTEPQPAATDRSSNAVCELCVLLTYS